MCMWLCVCDPYFLLSNTYTHTHTHTLSLSLCGERESHYLCMPFSPLSRVSTGCIGAALGGVLGYRRKKSIPLNVVWVGTCFGLAGYCFEGVCRVFVSFSLYVARAIFLRVYQPRSPPIALSLLSFSLLSFSPSFFIPASVSLSVSLARSLSHSLSLALSLSLSLHHSRSLSHTHSLFLCSFIHPFNLSEFLFSFLILSPFHFTCNPNQFSCLCPHLILFISFLVTSNLIHSHPLCFLYRSHICVSFPPTFARCLFI